MTFIPWSIKNASAIAKLEKEIFSDPWSTNAVISSIETEVFSGECLVFTEKKSVNCIVDKIKICDNLAECEDNIVGYYGFYALPPEGHIANIAVKAEYRGLGIGKMLLERLLFVGRQKDCWDFTLEVRKSNYVAISLYEKYGFKALGLRTKYYSDGEDAVIMWLKTDDKTREQEST